MARQRTLWSPVEIEWLEANAEHFSVKQLAISLAKSETAVRARIRGEEAPSVKKARFKAGPRDDLPGVSVRSLWEANILRWLTHNDREWEYEPRRFEFPNEKRGAKSYLPDIWLPKEQIWIEVKGRLMSSDKTRMKRFKKHYPEDFAKLVAIPGSATDEAATFFASIGVPCVAFYRDLDRECADTVLNWGQ